MIKCENKCILEKFDGCCHSCSEFGTCKSACSEHPNECGCATFDEESGLELFKAQHIVILNGISDLVLAKKKIEEDEKQMKEQLKTAMEKYGIKKLDSDVVTITYVGATTSVSVDTAKLKKLHPKIAEECSKTSSKSAYIKIDTKGVK